jgi:phage FluMu protein Com
MSDSMLFICNECNWGLSRIKGSWECVRCKNDRKIKSTIRRTTYSNKEKQ